MTLIINKPRTTPHHRPLIALTGPKGSGKDAAAKIITKCLVQPNGEYNIFKHIKFAGPLKDACRELFGWDDRHLEGNLKEVVDERYGVSPRKAMQTLGTEWGRNIINPNLWTEVARNRIREIKYGLVIVSDCRFDNEAQMIHDEGGIVIQVVRPGTSPVAEHASELGVSSELIDMTIDNSGTLDDLSVSIKRLGLKCIFGLNR